MLCKTVQMLSSVIMGDKDHGSECFCQLWWTWCPFALVVWESNNAYNTWDAAVSGGEMTRVAVQNSADFVMPIETILRLQKELIWFFHAVIMTKPNLLKA